MFPMNVQPAEKQSLDPDGRLDVMGVFLTIQGEGPFAGRRAVFVRLAGCNLTCSRCDTTYTGRGRETLGVEELAGEVSRAWDSRPALVVLTGGEPFRQNIAPLCKHLLSGGAEVQIETNGTLSNPDFPFAALGLTVVCSPKAGRVHDDIAHYCRHYKYVLEAGLADPKDGLPLSVLGNGVRPARPWDNRAATGIPYTVWVQPQDDGDPSRNAANTAAAVASALAHGHRLSFQSHKHLGVK